MLLSFTFLYVCSKKCLTDRSSGQRIAVVAKQSSCELTTALRGGGEIRQTPGSLAYKAVPIQGSGVEGHGGQGWGWLAESFLEPIDTLT